ncbi:lichenicidin alpha family lanthipeptide [Clostridium cellulovorans]|uniref:Plantaricin C family lantibiotic n=1 Tax=Clostridium cellulovorans (strain ATCC 35296 / DSM 3052 / OCM 3 / 743B) TaxID=573061 RepID=D9SN98_CLOC7|nr:lichenicidin alpha family lanthipeptide [Clostridium cellulovorans]ADL53890.1 hypothetical protein Clocel_4229 [Clostridium cellulovorans 743B]
MKNYEELFNEVNENASLQAELNGGSIATTIVCTIAQSLLGCVGSYVLGNKGYGCTVTNECMSNCR